MLLKLIEKILILKMLTRPIMDCVCMVKLIFRELFIYLYILLIQKLFQYKM